MRLPCYYNCIDHVGGSVAMTRSVSYFLLQAIVVMSVRVSFSTL